MDPRKVAVTLVCAADDEPALEAVLERLRTSGLEAELVAGVDQQPRRVGEAIDRCGEWGVIVACTSRRLDGAELRKVEGVFSARRGPNHAIVRVDIGQTKPEIVAAIQRAVEAFAANQGRIIRRPAAQERQAREVIPVNDIGNLALPVVRLDPNEELEGDTTRIQLPDNPKAAELSRRRRAVREHQRERKRIAERSGPIAAATADLPEPRQPDALDENAAKLDRMMVVMIIGAGILAVLAALWVSGGW